jgi:hypothetical protein
MIWVRNTVASLSQMSHFMDSWGKNAAGKDTPATRDWH